MHGRDNFAKYVISKVNDNSSKKSNLLGPSRVLSIISNKGGVGKSHFAINISCALAKAGRKVLLIDCDLGNGTTGWKFGLNPQHVMRDFFAGDKTLEELINPTPYEFLCFIGGSTGDFDLANINYARKVKFINSYMKLAKQGIFDDIIIDLGASIEKKVIDFALASYRVVIITTPQDIISGYGCLKGSFMRFVQLSNGSKDYMPDDRVYRPLIVVNQVQEKGMGRKIFQAMSDLIGEASSQVLTDLGQGPGAFKIEPSFLGEIPYAGNMFIQSELACTAVIEKYPHSDASSAFRELANTLMIMPYSSEKRKLRSEFLKQWAGVGIY